MSRYNRRPKRCPGLPVAYCLLAEKTDVEEETWEKKGMLGFPALGYLSGFYIQISHLPQWRRRALSRGKGGFEQIRVLFDLYTPATSFYFWIYCVSYWILIAVILWRIVLFCIWQWMNDMTCVSRCMSAIQFQARHCQYGHMDYVMIFLCRISYWISTCKYCIFG